MRRSSTVLHKIHFKTGNRARGLLSDVSDIHERSHDEPTTSRRGSVWHANPRRQCVNLHDWKITARLEGAVDSRGWPRFRR